MTIESGAGQRIRQRREELGLSLREVARRTSLTASFLSLLERGQSNASIDSLRKIADALDVTLLHFLGEAPASEARTSGSAAVWVVRANVRPRLILPDEGATYELLTPDVNRTVEVFRGCLSPGSGNVARPLKQPIEECIYVLAGKLLVEVAGQTVILDPGDNIYFEGATLTRLECASENEDAVWISVITPPVF